jgi:hypothetical protein
MHLFIAAALLLVITEARSEDKYALLIGVDHPRIGAEYVTPLEYPSKDVDDFARVLEKNNYHVQALKNGNATRRTILMYLADLAERIQPDDTFILYYSGHGLRNVRNNKTYWVTWEVDTSLIDADGIRLQHLIEYALDVPAKRKLILLDHCFAGDVGLPAPSPAELAGAATAPQPQPAQPQPAQPQPAGGTAARATTRSPGAVTKTAIPIDEFRQQVNPRVSGVVVVPASRNEALESTTLKHGVFTWVLLRAFNSRDADTLDPKGRLTLGELTNYLSARVPVVAKEVSDVEGAMAAPIPMDNGSNLNAWVLADLPLQGGEADDQAAAFKETLRTWEASSLITYDTRIRCNEVIERWLIATKNRTPLTGNDDRIWRYLKSAMESTLNEDTRAKTLDEDVKGVH